MWVSRKKWDKLQEDIHTLKVTVANLRQRLDFNPPYTNPYRSAFSARPSLEDLKQEFMRTHEFVPDKPGEWKEK
jgi:hypothetical protein